MDVSRTLSPRAWIELFLLALIWGGSFFAVAIALREVPFMTAAAHRVFWAALMLWIFVLARRLPLPKDPRVWFAFLVMGVLNNVIPFSLLNWGQTHIESGLVSILNATTALFGVLMAALLLPDERLVPRKTVGIALGFVGVVVTIGWTALLEIDLRSLAQIAILAATLSYAIASVFARLNLSGVEPSVAAMGMLTGSSLVQIPLAWMLEGPIRLDLHLSTWLAIGYFALFSTALAYLLYYRVLRMAGAGNLMLVTLLIPPIAIFLGAVFLDESLSPSTYLGFAIIGLGLVILDGRLAAKLFQRKSK